MSYGAPARARQHAAGFEFEAQEPDSRVQRESLLNITATTAPAALTPDKVAFVSVFWIPSGVRL